MKILLAVDGSPFSEKAVGALIAEAKPAESDVRVLHVIEPFALYPDGQGWGYAAGAGGVYDDEREEAKNLVAQAGQKLRDAGFRVTTAVEIGDPKTVILDSAAQWPADLIVLGSHGRKGLERFLMGSVSEAVARHAPCSVQIVRGPAR
jgi:nucleotide-binding universal stress UspA family protein